MPRPVMPSEETLARASHLMRCPDASPACRSVGAYAVESAKNLYLRPEKKARRNQRSRRRGGRS
jgi:hypothetical protein